jgi:hypothetical protein
MMAKAFRVLLQVALYAAFAVVIGWLSIMPPFHYASADMATIKLSLSHATDRIVPCVKLTPEEIAKLAPNMRRTLSCERARLPLTIEIDIDGISAVQLEAQPSGLWNDGPASVYERFDVAPGQHRITARLRDSERADGWDYEHSEDVVLEPGRYFTISFRSETGGFHYR